MKGILRILASVTALAFALILVTGSGFSETSAKGPGGSHGTASNITQPGSIQGSKGTKNQDSPTESVGFNYGKIEQKYTTQKPDGTDSKGAGDVSKAVNKMFKQWPKQ